MQHPPFLLLAKQAAQAAQGTAQLIQLQLCLDPVDQIVDLFIGQIDTNQLLNDGNRILLKLFQQILIGLQLLRFLP